MPLHERPIEQIHYSLHREINEFYWASAIKNFGINLVSLFGPIFIYQFFDNSLIWAILFYALQYGAYALVVPWSARLLGRVGLKKMMAMGNPFLGVYLIMLALAAGGGLIFIVIAFIAKVIYLSIFWPARHTDFARFSSEKKQARQVGVVNIIIAIIKTIAPVLGALIIVYLGFNSLFIISALIVFTASVPLFFSPEVYESFTLTWRQSMRRVFLPERRRVAAGFAFQGAEYLIGMIVFPIFIFEVIKDIGTIGWVTSLSLILALIFTYLVGWLSDRKGNRRMISYTSIIHAFSWLITIFIGTPIQYLVISSFYRLAEIANHLPLSSYFFKRAHRQGHDIVEYVVFHEVVHGLSRMFIGFVIAVIAAFGVTSFWPYFVLAAIAAFMYRVIVPPNKSVAR